MPQARSSGGSRSRSASTKGAAGSSSGAKRTSSSASGAKRSSSSTRTARAGGTGTRASAAAGKGRTEQAKATAGAAAGAAEARIEAAAQRLRKLNERIIEAGKEAGETTLSSYEKALKAIASTLERGPGSSDIEWVSNLATTQAKFIRDVTTAWTNAARGMLK